MVFYHRFESDLTDSSSYRLSKHLAVWLLLQGGKASLAVVNEVFSTSRQQVRSAIEHRQSLALCENTILYCGNQENGKKAIGDHDILALIEHIVVSKSRVVSIAEISDLLGEPSSRIRWAISNYSTWSRRYRPGSNFDLSRCFSDWPPCWGQE